MTICMYLNAPVAANALWAYIRVPNAYPKYGAYLVQDADFGTVKFSDDGHTPQIQDVHVQAKTWQWICVVAGNGLFVYEMRSDR